MGDSLDVVAVGVEHKSAVIAGVIVPLARRIVVTVPGGDRLSVELVDACPVSGGEGEMDVFVSGRLADQLSSGGVTVRLPRSARKCAYVGACAPSRNPSPVAIVS
jgi:hypothetical protein